ncbi:uncharacterized protein rab44 isoform X3 [Etheostoma spectabile]|nr:uncharacterized protein LOC116674383 isoform X3 [Etheostoma spectabile]
MEIFNSSEGKEAHQSEYSLNKPHEKEITPTDMHEIPQIDDLSESVINDATDNSEIISANLADQTEVSDTYQCELIVKRTGDSPANQKTSNSDKQDEHPTKENSFESLGRNHEDSHIYDIKEPQISHIEGVDTALGQVYETEGRVQDDTKPSAEQTGLQEMEGLVPEMERESSLQTLQSEINAPLDSQPQHSNTGFNPIGNRRKLGSSRKTKGRQHVKDSVAESYHNPTEEVVGDTRDNEPLETTEMSLSIETAVKEKSLETMLEEMNQFDTAQTEDVCDQVKENALVGGNLHSSLTVDQQMIDQSNATEMPEDELSNVCFVKEENKEEDDHTELFRQDGNLQTHYLVSESCVKLEDIDYSITPEITTDKHPPKEHTEPHCSVEQAICLSPKRELPTNDRQMEIFNSSEGKEAHQSEYSLNKPHEKEITPTDMHEIPQIDDLSESVIHDATENSEIFSGNLADPIEVTDTYQCELTVKSTDCSLTKQELSNPDKHVNHPTKENNFEALEQENKDRHVYGSKKPQISDIERPDTTLDRVYEIEDRVEDDIKPSAEHTGHQEKEELLSEMEESESSLQTLQSEINASFEAQPQHRDTSLNSFGNRRKLGSNRKNKGRQHDKGSVAESYNLHKEDVESTRDNEAFETRQMVLAIERTSHSSQGSERDIKPATHDSSLYTAIMPGYSSDIPGPTTTNHPEADLESVNTKSENPLYENPLYDHDFKVEVSDKSVESTLEGTDQSDTLQSQEVTSAHHSEDAVNTVHEQEVKPTEMPQIDDLSESVINDATDNSEIISANLADQTEVSDTYQCELIVKRTGDSPANQKNSNSDKQDEHPTKENSFESLGRNHEDSHIYDIKEPQISHIEGVDTALGQVYETEGRVQDDTKPSAEQTGLQEMEGLVPEMERESSLQTLQSEINAPLDSQPQHSNTGFNPIGNRRKLGSSRKTKGRQHVKDSVAESYHNPTEEVVGDTRDNEPLETTEMSLSIETAVKEKSLETMLEEMNQFDTAQTEDVCGQVNKNAHVGGNLLSSLTVDQQSKSTEMPDEELPNVCFLTEKEKLKNVNLQTNYLVSEDCVKSEDTDYCITPEITTDKHTHKEHTEPHCSVEQAICLSPKEELSTSDEQKEHVNLFQIRGARHSEDAINEVHEEEVKPTQMHQIDNFSIEDSQSSLQTLHSERNVLLDSQPFDSYQSIKGQSPTGFNTKGNRRKFGSNRKNKGPQVKDTTKLSYLTETMRQEELKEQANQDVKPAGEIRTFGSTVNGEENTEKMSEEGTILSQNVMDSRTVVTADIHSSSGKDDFVKSKEVNETENKLIKETENLNQLTECDTVKMELTQSPKISVWKDDSDIQNVSYDENVTARPIADGLEQEGAFQVHDTEVLSCDKEFNEQQTNGTSQILGDVTIKAYNSGVESSMCVPVSRQDKDGEQKDHEAQEINISQVIPHAELFSASQNKTDTLALFDIGLEENIQAEPAGDVSEESGISSQQRIQEITTLDESENLKGRSKQKRRKMGSTRQTQLNRKPEEKRGETKERDFNTEADMRKVDKMEAVEDLQIIVTAEVSQNEHAKPSLSPKNKEQQETTRSDLQIIQSNMIPDIDYSNTLLAELSVCHNKEVVNPVKLVHVSDVRDSESNVDVSVESSQLDDFTTTEMYITSVLAGRHSINPLLSANMDSTNTGITGESCVSLCETTQSPQNDEKQPESVNVINDQALKSADEPVVADLEIVKSVVRGGAEEEHMSAQAYKTRTKQNEGAHTKIPEMINANLDSTNKRRKMGSTRRSLGSRTKQEDLYEKQKEDNEATEAATIVEVGEAESFSGNIGVPQLHKDSGSEQRKEKEFETAEYYFKPHQTFEENPVSHGQLVETEHQLTPNYLPAIQSTSPKHDLMSESASSRKIRKMGSNRKSHENQTAKRDKMTDAQIGRDVRSITDESANKTTEELREESLGPDQISEVNTSDKKPSPNFSTSKATEQPASEKTPKPVTPVQHPSAEIRLAQKSQQKFSLAANSRAANLQSNTYNVIMVGDSSVGKTSFMKRAQSGKFSLDLPASVGLDSCMWTVVVDGKYVVLQLWDTAGQERFHSMTRQIFHKANAFLLMYDITSSQSFSAVSYWANCIQEGAAEDVTILLVGNKSDCAERQVKTQEVEVLAKEYNFEFMECSAATGENVVQSLETVARMLSQKVDTREEAMELKKEPNKKKSSGCC